MTVEEAIAVVAERAIWAVTRDVEWADYGDIGESDWNRVVDEIDRQLDINQTNLELFSAAYDLLASRASNEASP